MLGIASFPRQVVYELDECNEIGVDAVYLGLAQAARRHLDRFSTRSSRREKCVRAMCAFIFHGSEIAATCLSPGGSVQVPSPPILTSAR
jgi:hypothetical protein